jgi:hypothetical protein
VNDNPYAWPPDERGEEPLLHVIGVDPGVATGWAYLRCGLRALLMRGWAGASIDSKTAWCVGTIDGRALGEVEAIDALVDITRSVWQEVEQEWGDRFVVCFEDFILLELSSDRDLLAPVRFTAAYRDRMRIFRYPFYRVKASDSKLTITDVRLRNWNMYVPSSEDHERDALRVGIMGARQWSGSPEFRKYVDHMQYRNTGEPEGQAENGPQ